MLITKEIIEQLKVGDILPNMFGEMRAVTRIDRKGVDKYGKHYAKFMQELDTVYKGRKYFADMSGEIIEGEPIYLIKKFGAPNL